MRHFSRALIVGLAVCTALPMPGCALRPAESEQAASARDYRIAAKAYEASVNTMARLASAGHVDLETAEAFELARASSSRLLSEWHTSIADGKPFDGGAALDSALDALIAAADKAQKGAK